MAYFESMSNLQRERYKGRTRLILFSVVQLPNHRTKNMLKRTANLVEKTEIFLMFYVRRGEDFLDIWKLY